jgi:hypothetical protein
MGPGIQTNWFAHRLTSHGSDARRAGSWPRTVQSSFLTAIELNARQMDWRAEESGTCECVACDGWSA